MDQLPDNMPLPILKERCAQEVNNYYQGKQSDECYCLELFKRALIDDNNDAWIALQEQFRGNVLYWLRCHSRGREALLLETEQNYVDDTFKRLWQWGHNQKAALEKLPDFNSLTGFRSLAGALKFLHLCLDTLIIDNLRSAARQKSEDLAEHDRPISSTHEEHVIRKELWSAIRTIVLDDREFRVIFLIYHE
jgi:DNA-directed RNA polymerase specialized sigma24 family protein